MALLRRPSAAASAAAAAPAAAGAAFDAAAAAAAAVAAAALSLCYLTFRQTELSTAAVRVHRVCAKYFAACV